MSQAPTLFGVEECGRITTCGVNGCDNPKANGSHVEALVRRLGPERTIELVRMLPAASE